MGSLVGGELQRQDDMAACQQVGLCCHSSTVEDNVLHTAEKRDKIGLQDWDYYGEKCVSGHLPVVRSSGESVCRASMMSEKVPCEKKKETQPTRRA